MLKGLANARLYPEPLSRQSGDIDIWVPCGCDKVERLLLGMGLRHFMDYFVLLEVHYWHDTISLIPERIRRRKAFL